jgi:hypothetical protein
MSREEWKSEYKILIQKHTWNLMGSTTKKVNHKYQVVILPQVQIQEKKIFKKLKAYLITCGFTQQLKVFSYKIIILLNIKMTSFTTLLF